MDRNLIPYHTVRKAATEEGEEAQRKRGEDREKADQTNEEAIQIGAESGKGED